LLNRSVIAGYVPGHIITDSEGLDVPNGRYHCC